MSEEPAHEVRATARPAFTVRAVAERRELREADAGEVEPVRHVDDSGAEDARDDEDRWLRQLREALAETMGDHDAPAEPHWDDATPTPARADDPAPKMAAATAATAEPVDRDGVVERLAALEADVRALAERLDGIAARLDALAQDDVVPRITDEVRRLLDQRQPKFPFTRKR